MNCMSNLFIPGAAKSGTSSLHEYLKQHPDINMSSTKEPHFFCEDRSEKEWQNYLEMFDDSYKYNGESSTGYMVFDGVIERIKEHIPEAKFIFLLRNPIDRVFSHFKWLQGYGYEEKSFKEAFYADYTLKPKYKENIHVIGYKNYYHWGLYFHYLKEYYKNFDHNDILILTTEALHKNPQATMDKCTDFLKLEKYQFDFSVKSNESINIQNKSLYKFIRNYQLKEGLLKQLYHLFPAFIRESVYNVRKKITTIFEKNAKKNIIVLDDSLRDIMKEEYKDDVAKLKRLTGYHFMEWKDFL